MSIFDLALPLTYEVHHLSTGISAIVYDANGCGIDTHLYEEQAAQIVKACNAYDDLVAALAPFAKLAAAYETLYGFGDSEPVDARHNGKVNNFPPLIVGDLRAARDALAKAVQS